MEGQGGRNIYALSDLLGSIARAIGKFYGGEYWIKAEISELQVNRSSGHVYLDLVEKGEQEVAARCRAMIWRQSYTNISKKLALAEVSQLSRGVEIVALATVSFHPQYGLSLIILDVDTDFALGQLERQRKETIERLKRDGVLELNKALILQRPAKRIALISSATAAGWGDFRKHISDSGLSSYLQILFLPAKMQGEETAESIISQLEWVAQHLELFDLVAIIRGGGSQQDLRAFDSYPLAYYCSQFPLPIVTGIGHERDLSVLDMVAHTSMKTPTAVADFLLSNIVRELEILDTLEQRTTRSVQYKLLAEHRRLDLLAARIPNMGQRFLHDKVSQLTALEHRLFRSWQTLVQREAESLQRKTAKLGMLKERITLRSEGQLERLIERLRAAQRQLLTTEKTRQEQLAQWLRMIHPDEVLKRGYAIVRGPRGIVSSGSSLKKGDDVEILFYREQVVAEVRAVKEKAK